MSLRHTTAKLVPGTGMKICQQIKRMTDADIRLSRFEFFLNGFAPQGGFALICNLLFFEEGIVRLLSRLFRKANNDVIIVSGLPRSGTSMTMRMLEAGGLEVVTDHIRTPNEDNPRGYYEFERAKKLPDGDTAWVKDARGKVVKAISALLKHFPSEYTYKVLFMRRSMAEILASQQRMLVRRGEEPSRVDDAQMAQLFEKHLAEVYAWLDVQANITYINVDYNAMLGNPQPQVQQMQSFLARDLDVEQMIAVVDPSLYRQRKSR